MYCKISKYEFIDLLYLYNNILLFNSYKITNILGQRSVTVNFQSIFFLYYFENFIHFNKYKYELDEIFF